MYYFIVNTTARRGSAAHVWNEAKVVLRKKGIAYKAYETTFEGHATQIARELTSGATEAVHIIILGGDGTINEVINGISDFDMVKIGVIPTGSGNDFARGLSIKGSTEEIIEDILSNEIGTKIDLGRVIWGEKRKKRLFAISSGIGFDALVVKHAMTSYLKKILNAIRLGSLTYVLLAIHSLLTMDTFDMKISLGSKGERAFSKVIFAAAMNLPMEGGGVAMAPKATPTDGKLSFSVASGIPKLLLLPCFALLVLSKHEKLRYFRSVHEKTCHIHTETPVTLHADGEYLADITDVWYECVPSQLELLNTLQDK